jgi:hypothetical protein
MNLVTISGTLIRQDQDGRYCLNDLHKAAGGEQKHKPSEWLRIQQAQDLIDELGKAGIPALVSNHGGKTPGTYVCKELVYAYAMWISAPFQVKVIRAYDAMATGQPKPTIENNVSALLLIGDAVAKVAGVKPGMAMAATLDAINVNTGLDVEPMRKALPSSSEPSPKLNPKTIGTKLGMSAQAVNKRLQELGFQKKSERGEWELTESGTEYGEALPFAKNGHAGYQVLWRNNVIEAISARTS